MIGKKGGGGGDVIVPRYLLRHLNESGVVGGHGIVSRRQFVCARDLGPFERGDPRYDLCPLAANGGLVCHG